MGGGAKGCKDAHTAVNAGRAAKAEHDGGGAAGLGIGKQHARAIRIRVEGIERVADRGQPSGCGDIDESRVPSEEILRLGQAPHRIRCGQGNGLGFLPARRGGLGQHLGGAFPAIGHRQGGDSGVGVVLADSIGDSGCGFRGRSGTFKRVRRDNNMHARDYKARDPRGGFLLGIRTFYRKYLTLLSQVKAGKWGSEK